MGSGASIPEDKHIVIVGGGYGGFAVANALKKSGSNFTLISDSPVLYHNIASVRGLVEKDFGKKLMIPLDKIYGDKLKLGKMTSVNPSEKKVVLESGDSVSYDVLVIATGTSGGFPFKLQSVDVDEQVTRMGNFREMVEKAQRIVVIGGGPTGTEQACEIISKWPGKEVTLLHGREQLIGGGYSPAFYKKLDETLEKLKIKVIKDEKIEDLDNIELETVNAVTVRTNKGTELEADLIIKCVGLRVRSDAYQDGLGDAVNEQGCLKVNEFLQVDGHEDIYAIGDCNSTGPNLAYAAGEQGELFVRNLKNKFAGKAMTGWKADGLPVTIVMSLGPNHAIGQLKSGKLLPEFIPKMLKSKNMMVPDMWKKAGLKVPS